MSELIHTGTLAHPVIADDDEHCARPGCDHIRSDHSGPLSHDEPPESFEHGYGYCVSRQDFHCARFVAAAT